MKANNFDVLRLIAALAVLVSHAVPLSYGSNQREAVWRFSHGQTTLGELSVAVFFVISGYLITMSWMRSPDPLSFVSARMLRLLPGLLAMLVLVAVVAGPLLTSWTLAEYTASPTVQNFIISNAFLLNDVSVLPGVFTKNPFGPAVNGSLWTLYYEAVCYALVLALGLAGCLNRWTAAGLTIVGLLASAVWWGGAYVQFGTLFLAGSTIYFWRPPLRGWIAALCCCAVMAAMMTGGLRLILATAGAYLTIYLAIATRPIRLPIWATRTDMSYGIYIYAFPVQQAVSTALGNEASCMANIALSTPVVLVLSWLSWRFVEGPSLTWKRRFLSHNRAPALF